MPRLSRTDTGGTNRHSVVLNSPHGPAYFQNSWTSSSGGGGGCIQRDVVCLVGGVRLLTALSNALTRSVRLANIWMIVSNLSWVSPVAALVGGGAGFLPVGAADSATPRDLGTSSKFGPGSPTMFILQTRLASVGE